MRKQKQFENGGKYLALPLVTFFAVMILSYFSHAQEVANLISLEKAYSLALKTHERIVIAEREVVKSKLLPKKATTTIMPRISVTGGYKRLGDPIEFRGLETVPEDQWLGNLEFSQPLYEGRFFPLRRQAFQAIDSTIENYYLTAEEILFKVAQAYYELLKAKELAENAKEIFKLTGEKLRVSKVRFEAGEVTEDVVIRSELNLIRSKSKLIRNINQLRLAKDILKTLIGLKTQDFDVTKPPTLKVLSGSYGELVHKAFENRHDYKRAFLHVDLAESEVELSKARFHPKLAGSWNYYLTDDPTFEQEEDYWVALLKLEVPLFEGGLRFLDLKEKRESLRQAKLALEDLEDTIRIEVGSGMLSVQTEESILDNLTKEVELAEKNYDIVFAKFEFGAATGVELNDALAALDSATTELITKTYNYQVSILNLEKAVGLFARDYILRDKEFFAK